MAEMMIYTFKVRNGSLYEVGPLARKQTLAKAAPGVIRRSDGSPSIRSHDGEVFAWQKQTE